MFYVAEAFLEGEGLSFSSRSAVTSAFGRHFAKTGKAPIEFHRSLIRAEELRRRGDYGPFESVSFQDAQEQVTQAERFLDLAQRLLGPPLPPGAATE